MNTSRFKFPRRVRIHGGECGAVARALHHAAQKDALMSYERAFLCQADVEKASRSTFFERKQMSIKTLKRIALVAVSAMGIGLLSVAPSNAAAQPNLNCTTAYTVTDGGVCTGVAGPANYVTITAVGSVYAVVTGGTFTDGTTAKTITSTTANIATPTAGTITVNGYLITAGVAASTATDTITITVGTANKGLVNASTSTSVLKSGASWAAGLSATTDDTVVASRALSGGLPVVAGSAKVILGQANGAITGTTSVAASISGPGSLILTTSASAASTIASGRAVSSTVATTTETFYVFVLSDGTAGTATVSISAGAFSSTETVTFYGAVATVTPTVVNSVIPVGNAGAAAGAITVVLKDANGNPVPGITPTETSSATTIINETGTCTASDSTGKSTCGLVGVAAGTANITITASGVAATPVSIRVGSSPASVKMAFDKVNYQPGEKVTVTVTLLDASGLAVPNANYANTFSAAGVSSSLAFAVVPAASGVALGSSVTTTGSTGTATYVGNMPLSSGTVTLTATGGSSLATAGQVAVTASAVVDAADAITAAADAAAEAIDAANAATDAANLAAEAADAATVAAEEARDAADAATAAVEELATQVATLMAALKAQLTTLANTVAKIAKKVKA